MKFIKNFQFMAYKLIIEKVYDFENMSIEKYFFLNKWYVKYDNSPTIDLLYILKIYFSLLWHSGKATRFISILFHYAAA